MIVAEELKKRLFIWGVSAIAVSPRMPFDKTWSIGGGEITHNFRKLLLCLVSLNFLRLFVSQQGTAQWFYSDALGVIEVVGLTFLCFLSPYILYGYMSRLINVERQRRDLTTWLIVAGALSLAGVTFSRVLHPNIWFLKKLANVTSAFPILKCLKTYSQLITPHHGRGHVMAQTLKIMEIFHLVTQMLSAIGFAFDNSSDSATQTQWSEMLDAFRNCAFVSDWSRILMHATFLNTLDEQNYLQPVNPQTDRPVPMIGEDRQD